MSRGERRLAAIMFTDMVGYTALGQRNESLSIELAEEQRKLLRPIFKRHGGREVKTMGDAFLVEFSSALEAARCAYDIQRATREFNITLPEEQRVHIRVGVHVGDVVESQGDISGDAVNVASRMQSLADDGGICVTRQVYDQVQNKFELPLKSLGKRSLKNVRAPMEVYRMVLPWEDQQVAMAEMDAKTVAVLPFANMSPDPNDSYFADGITEEIISTLSGVSGLSVISRTSIMGYKGTTKRVREIGSELEAGSVLEGSFRKAGNKIRVTTQLIDAKNDKHLWAQSYDRDLTDIFAVQSDIAEQVAGALKVKLLSKEKEALEQKPTGSTESYSLYIKGRFFWNERTKESVKKAIRYFEEAVRLDLNFALAYSGLADCYLIQQDRGWASHSEAGPLAKRHAEKALELNGDLAEAHASLGLALYNQWDLAGAERELKQAIALKPNYSMVYHWYAGLLSDLGRHYEALESEKRALELDPYSSTIIQGIGIVLLYMGRTQEAIAQFEKLAEMDPEFASVHFFSAWAHEGLGEFDEAIKEAKRASETQGPHSFAKLGLASIYARAGKREQAVKLLEEIQSDTFGDYKSPTLVAMVKFGLGENDEAFSWLERAYQEHDLGLLYFREFPWCSEYRSDPRWLVIERKMGLSKR